MSRFLSFVRSHPAALALLLCLLSGVWVFAHGVPTLQNDDIQIQFLLLNGGEEGSSHSLFTHPWLEGILVAATKTIPTLSWYLAFQIGLFFLAAFYLSLFLASHLLKEPCQGTIARIVIPVVFLFAFFWLTHLLTSLQYTMVAIFASCCAWLALLFFARRPSFVHAAAAATLFWGALSLRFASVVPGLAMGCGLAVFACLSRRRRGGGQQEKTLRRYLIGTSAFALLAALLSITHESSYEPEWKDAASYLRTRVAISDFPDTSGLDKTTDYRKLGLSPNDVAFFKGFWFHPAWDHLPLARQALLVHRHGCPGLFGSEMAARRGISSFDYRRFADVVKDLRQATPWVPLAAILLLPLLFLRRLPTKKQMCALIPLAFVLFAVVAAGRPVARVYEPVLGFTTVFAGALIPLRGRGACPSRAQTAAVLLLSILCVLFVFRHYRHGIPLAAADTPATYCAHNPDVTFFTATVQNAYELFPASLACSPAAAWRKSNIVPIADGWNFHTPSYRRYLAKRRIVDPYRALLDDRSRLLTFIPHEKTIFFDRLRAFYRERYGIRVDLVLEAVVAPCRIWRVVSRSTSEETRRADEAQP